MRSKLDDLRIQIIIKDNEDFFRFYYYGLNSVILRKHFAKLFPGDFVRRLKEWKELGLIKSTMICNNSVITLCKCTHLIGIVDKNITHKPTAHMILKSTLKMEYYFSMGLTTSEDMLLHMTMGNDTVQNNCCSRVFTSWVSQDNSDFTSICNDFSICTLDKLATNYSFVDNVKCGKTKKVIVPTAVHYIIKSKNNRGHEKDIINLYIYLKSIFEVEGYSILPRVKIISFQHDIQQDKILKRLMQEEEFVTFTLEDMQKIFTFCCYKYPFGKPLLQ